MYTQAILTRQQALAAAIPQTVTAVAADSHEHPGRGLVLHPLVHGNVPAPDLTKHIAETGHTRVGRPHTVCSLPQRGECVTIIKINAITVPAEGGDELARRFAARAGAVDNQDGFEGFELLRPTDDRTTWLVVTRWRDEASFQAWLTSPAFSHGHRHATVQAAGASGHGEGGEAARPVGVSSELWSFEIAGGSRGN